ncbi:hypothetical protein OS493_040471, partial [Desmophyllum pertusum]
VLNLFLALLLNAFDGGDEEDENDEDGENEESVFKKLLGKLTQTKKTSVFPVTEYPLAEGSWNSSQEIPTTGKENSKKTNTGKEYSTVGRRRSILIVISIIVRVI